MREIKFRVIIDNKLFGYEKLSESGWQFYSLAIDTDENDRILRWNSGTMPKLGKEFGVVKIKRQQFTGFVDSNGTEIYEGDNVKRSEHFRGHNAKGRVVFKRGCFYLDKEDYTIESFLYDNNSKMDLTIISDK